MIAVGQNEPGRERMDRCVGEAVRRLPLPKRAQHRAMRDRPEREDDTQARHRAEFIRQEPVAGGDLGWGGLVLRRHAAHRVADARTRQDEFVIGPLVIRAGGQSEPEQGGVEKIARPVAGEGPPGPVRTTQARRETDDEERRTDGAEGGNGRVVPRPIRVRCEPATVVVAERGKTRAEPAIRLRR